MSIFFNPAKADGMMKKLPIEKILPNPMQPRRHFDEDSIRALADSIAQYGVIQPISVRALSANGKYELIAGERRLRAARIAGLAEIPCMILRAGERRSACLAITENLQRRDLDLFEEADALGRLLSAGGCTQSALAESLSMSQSALANKLRLLRFDEVQREMIRKYHLSERHARALLRVPPEKRTETAEKIGQAGMSAAAAEEYIDALLCEHLVSGGWTRAHEKRAADGSGKKRRAAPSEKAENPPERKTVLPPAAGETGDGIERKSENAAKTPIRTFLLGDLTLFYNTLERSLSMLRSAGFAAALEKEENDGEVKVFITLKSGRS